MKDSQSKSTRHPLLFRVLHELILTSILVLILTGLYIHRPWFGDGGGFLMSAMRGAHFFFAAVLMIALGLRLVTLFVGRNRDWRFFIPGLSDLKILPGAINYYAYIGKKPETKKKYNPLQMISYSWMFLMLIFQIITGFALQYPDGWLRWLNYGIFGTEVNTRVAHNVVAWLCILFLIVHVYLTIRESYREMREMHLLSDIEETGQGAEE